MKGFIHYTNDSQYSPEHPFPISGYASPAEAIENGGNPSSIITLFVSTRREIFLPVREYKFKGRYEDYVNRAIATLYRPRREEVDVTSYVIPIDDPPSVPTVTVKRNVYQLEKVKENVYRQKSPLPIYEEYRFATMNIEIDGVSRDVPLYIGRLGSFITVNSIPMSVTTPR